MVGAYLGSNLYYDFNDDAKLEKGVDMLVSEVEGKIIEEGCRLEGDSSESENEAITIGDSDSESYLLLGSN